jgi:NAD+ diphosphatase
VNAARFDVSDHSEIGSRPHLGYTASLIDRAADRRSDDALLAKFEKDSRAGAYVIGGEMVVMRQRGDGADPLFSIADANGFGAAREKIFLGLVDEAPRFGFGLDAVVIEPLKSRNDLKVADLRSIAVQGLVDAKHLPPLAEAKAMIGWHAKHCFCSNCGAPTRTVQGGWRRDCPSCHVEHFPRTDPVVIMLVIAGERCVLGRSPRFAATMWSCLAGFCEPGETIEEAVRREVLEEVGITTGRVHYFASQPWPFPMSLMIGCHAEAKSDKIVVDRSEIEDARWFEREELAQMLALRHPGGLTTPPPIAIAHHIIRDYVENGSNVFR